MNKYMGAEFLHRCGQVVTVVNGLLMVLLACVFIREFLRLVSPESRGKREFHWLMLGMILAFGYANNQAYQRFFDAWVKAEVLNIQTDIIINAIKDRVGMGVTGYFMYLLSKRSRPEWLKGKYEDED